MKYEKNYKKDSTISKSIMELEKHTAKLYELGYRQMPIDMQEMVLTGINKNIVNKNPSPFTTITTKDPRDNEYVTLSGGVFQEVFETKTEENFGSFTFNTTTKTITKLNPKLQTEDRLQFLIDPVAFAYDFGARIYDSRLGRWLSTDPLQAKYPDLSPYVGIGNNPILFIDPDGKRIIINYKDAKGNLASYEYGSGLEVPDNDFVKRSLAAIDYNKNVELGNKVWTNLATSNGILFVENIEATEPYDGNTNKFIPAENKTINGVRIIGTIKWDANSNVEFYEKDDNGAMLGLGEITPATAFMHEAIHAEEFDKAQSIVNKYERQKAIDKYKTNAGNTNLGYDKQYDTKEEKRAIELETIFIKQMNVWELSNNPESPSIQPTRTNHEATINFNNNNADVKDLNPTK